MPMTFRIHTHCQYPGLARTQVHGRAHTYTAAHADAHMYARTKFIRCVRVCMHVVCMFTAHTSDSFGADVTAVTPSNGACKREW